MDSDDDGPFHARTDENMEERVSAPQPAGTLLPSPTRVADGWTVVKVAAHRGTCTYLRASGTNSTPPPTQSSTTTNTKADTTTTTSSDPTAAAAPVPPSQLPARHWYGAGPGRRCGGGDGGLIGVMIMHGLGHMGPGLGTSRQHHAPPARDIRLDTCAHGHLHPSTYRSQTPRRSARRRRQVARGGTRRRRGSVCVCPPRRGNILSRRRPPFCSVGSLRFRSASERINDDGTWTWTWTPSPRSTDGWDADGQEGRRCIEASPRQQSFRPNQGLTRRRLRGQRTPLPRGAGQQPTRSRRLVPCAGDRIKDGGSKTHWLTSIRPSSLAPDRHGSPAGYTERAGLAAEVWLASSEYMFSMHAPLAVAVQQAMAPLHGAAHDAPASRRRRSPRALRSWWWSRPSSDDFVSSPRPAGRRWSIKARSTECWTAHSSQRHPLTLVPSSASGGAAAYYSDCRLRGMGGLGTDGFPRSGFPPNDDGRVRPHQSDPSEGRSGRWSNLPILPCVRLMNASSRPPSLSPHSKPAAQRQKQAHGTSTTTSRQVDHEEGRYLPYVLAVRTVRVVVLLLASLRRFALLAATEAPGRRGRQTTREGKGIRPAGSSFASWPTPSSTLLPATRLFPHSRTRTSARQGPKASAPTAAGRALCWTDRPSATVAEAKETKGSGGGKKKEANSRTDVPCTCACSDRAEAIGLAGLTTDLGGWGEHPGRPEIGHRCNGRFGATPRRLLLRTRPCDGPCVSDHGRVRGLLQHPTISTDTIQWQVRSAVRADAREKARRGKGPYVVSGFLRSALMDRARTAPVRQHPPAALRVDRDAAGKGGWTEETQAESGASC
ncbi:hypothetical protein RJ55_02794 [Drechmeria coniospora]|nr:hypothetical protein RJ55_02794 [Drechmeria coniospora]